MKTVVMKQQMSGSRHDEQAWPNFGEEISVPDWEADELVAGGIAAWPEKKAETREDKAPGKAPEEAATPLTRTVRATTGQPRTAKDA